MKTKILALGICVLLVLPIFLLAEIAIILKQENSPLKITEYRTVYSYFDREYTISHLVSYLNTSEKKIVAIRLGFITFDAFNEFLDKFVGISIEEVEIDKMKAVSWQQSTYKAFSFKKYGTGLMYIDKVRFEDGSIWVLSKDEILPQIQEIQESFTEDLLKERKEEK